MQITKLGNEIIYRWFNKITCEYRDVKLNIELYNLKVINNNKCIYVKVKRYIHTLGSSSIYYIFLRIVGGWIAEKQNKRLRTQVNLCCVKGCSINLTDEMLYCLEYEWKSNLKYNSVL